MSCQQLYIEQIIQIILYIAKYIHVRFNYDNVSFEREGGHPPKMTPYIVKNEQSLIDKEHINDITGSVLISLLTNMTTIFIQIHERTGALWTW